MEAKKREQLLSQLKELITQLEKDTLKQTENEIDRGLGVMKSRIDILSALNKIDVGLQLVREGLVIL